MPSGQFIDDKTPRIWTSPDPSVYFQGTMNLQPTVLILEDNEDLRDITAEVLMNGGFTVRLTATGAELLSLLRSGFRPDCLLLDLGLPDMSSEDFFTEFRAIAGAHRIPVALASGCTDVAQAGERFGIKKWIRKPYDLDRLLDLVAELCRSGEALGRKPVPALGALTPSL